MGSKDRIPTKILKEEMEVAIHMRDLSILHLESKSWESVLTVRMDILDVVIGVER